MYRVKDLTPLTTFSFEKYYSLTLTQVAYISTECRKYFAIDGTQQGLTVKINPSVYPFFEREKTGNLPPF